MSDLERSNYLIQQVKQRKQDVEAEETLKMLRPYLREMRVREAKILALEEEALQKLIVVLNRELARR